MNIVIKAERQIKEIDKEFNNGYPFLKLQFYSNVLARQDRYPADKLISKEKKLRDAWSKVKEEGTINITGDMTVLQLEMALMDRFGLAAQVFRKSGRVWLETIRTDNWTLNDQNKHGRELSEEPIKDEEAGEDYDLHRED